VWCSRPRLRLRHPGQALTFRQFMQITVKLFATFRIGRFNVATQEYEPGTRVSDVITALEIPHAEIGMIMLNGRHAEPEQPLQEGASLALFPLLGGG
jgi:molybdopterin synthase sulfur carrier subunit